MENFFASLKCELIGTDVFRDLLQARDEVMRYIGGFYNPRRLHSELDYQPPDQFRPSTL